MFKPDLFSKSIPNWKKTNINKFEDFEILVKQIFGEIPVKQLNVKTSGSLEINSSNILISYETKKILVKKWKNQSTKKELMDVVNILLFLKEKNVLVAKPIKFKNNSYFLKTTSGIYTINDFIEGTYFSGEMEQLKNVALSIANLNNALLKLPLEKYPNYGPEYDYSKIKKIVDKTFNNRNNWKELFGENNTLLLKKNWNMIDRSLNYIKNINLNSVNKYPIHFDLHPHNILICNNGSIAFLDYDSIKTMNIGPAMSFAALKLCRQSVCISSPSKAKYISNLFVQELSKNLEGDKSWIDNIYEYAISEVLRRISIIFSLSFNDQKYWNKVLSIQVNHLIEAKMLFY